MSNEKPDDEKPEWVIYNDGEKIGEVINVHTEDEQVE